MKNRPTCDKCGSVLKNKDESASADLLPDGMPFAEIPNDQVASVAKEFRETVDYLYATLKGRCSVSPLKMMAAFGIELYLKSLNSRCVYSQDEDWDSGGYIVTAEPLRFGHPLVTLFDAIDEPIRHGLAQAYSRQPVFKDNRSLRDALVPYDSHFVKSRYPFEAAKSETKVTNEAGDDAKREEERKRKEEQEKRERDGHNITGLVELLRWIGEYVDSLSRTATFKPNPVVSTSLQELPQAQTPPVSEPR